MKAKEVFGSIAGLAIMLGMMAISVLVLTFFIKGGIWLSQRAMPWAFAISVIAFCIVVFFLLPLAIPRKTRGFSSASIFIASYLFGVTLWMLGLLLSYAIWGWTGVVIGILLGGVGVIPIALLATLIKGIWAAFFLLIGLIIATYACRIGAMHLAASLEDRW